MLVEKSNVEKPQRRLLVNTRLIFLLTFFVFFTACGRQTVSLPTEVPVPIAASALPPAVVSLTSQTQPANTPSITPTSTPILNVSNLSETVSLDHQEEIKRIIESYFELRYQALSVPQPDDFQLGKISELVSVEDDAQAFLDAELVKLTLEATYGELNGSRYVDYKFFLDFVDFSMDIETKLVTALVIENSEIVHEISARNNPANPLIARSSGLKHMILLREENNQWKLVSDYYNDFLWRTIRKDEKSTGDMLNQISTLESLINQTSE